MAEPNHREKWTEPRRKVIGVPLQKSIQKQDDGTLIVRGYFTSDRRDEVGDIITRFATERAIPRYRQWGNIRYMHMPRPVAKVLRMGSEDGLEWNEVEIKVIDPQTVFEVEQGLLTALSVGILVDFEDVEFLEDGGWIINNYTLAEISLVDHPANYDARLKDLPVDQGLRMLARQYGFDTLARSMTALINRELAMQEELIIENDAIEKEPLLEEQEKAIDDETAEPEAAPDESAEGEAEKDIQSEPEQAEKSLDEMFTDLVGVVRELADAVAEMRKTLETLTEVPSAKGQVEGDGLGEQAEQDDTPPVIGDRKGALPETVLPDDQVGKGTDHAPISDLRQALHKYFTQRNS